MSKTTADLNIAAHADVRAICDGLYRLETILTSGGLDAPWIARAREMLVRQSRRIAELEDALKPLECKACDGAGWLWSHELQVTPGDGGRDDTRYTCDMCDGSGHVVKGEGE